VTDAPFRSRSATAAVAHPPTRRPLIGVSASLHDFGDYGGVGVHRPLLDAGALPVTLPQLAEASDAVVAQVDAIVLAPGRDVEPQRYGQGEHPLLAATEPQRDAFELELVRRALDAGLPILGICRGIQVLNVALGGTLAQDVSLIAPGHPSDPGWERWKLVEASSLAGTPLPPHPRHSIAITPRSVLAQALGTTEIEVNSFHHQAIERLGDGLTIVATSEDGVPEAVELPGRAVLAVQWELQEERRVDGRFTRVFDWFVAAAAARAEQRDAGAVSGYERGLRFSVS
jgi:putative glutamine amidotransferase